MTFELTRVKTGLLCLREKHITAENYLRKSPVFMTFHSGPKEGFPGTSGGQFVACKALTVTWKSLQIFCLVRHLRQLAEIRYPAQG